MKEFGFSLIVRREGEIPCKFCERFFFHVLFAISPMWGGPGVDSVYETAGLTGACLPLMVELHGKGG